MLGSGILFGQQAGAGGSGHGGADEKQERAGGVSRWTRASQQQRTHLAVYCSHGQPAAKQVSPSHSIINAGSLAPARIPRAWEAASGGTLASFSFSPPSSRLEGGCTVSTKKLC